MDLRIIAVPGGKVLAIYIVFLSCCHGTLWLDVSHHHSHIYIGKQPIVKFPQPVKRVTGGGGVLNRSLNRIGLYSHVPS